MYLYTPTHKSYNTNALFNDLKKLGDLIHIIITGRKMTTVSSSPLASGIKTRKMRASKSSLFKRKPLIKRFKNPIFLSFK
jgi:hypothetical protein